MYLPATSSFLWGCVGVFLGSINMFSLCTSATLFLLHTSVSPSMPRAPDFSVLLGLMALVSPQMSAEVNPSDPHSVETCTFALNTFSILGKLTDFPSPRYVSLGTQDFALLGLLGSLDGLLSFRQDAK